MNVGSSNVLRKFILVLFFKMIIIFFRDVKCFYWVAGDFRTASCNTSWISMRFLQLWWLIISFCKRCLHSIDWLHIYITCLIDPYRLREHREAALDFFLPPKLIIKQRDMSWGSTSAVLCFVRILIVFFSSFFFEAYFSESAGYGYKFSFLSIFLWRQDTFYMVRLKHFVLHAFFIFHDLPAF